jgi:hypothetical protein
MESTQYALAVLTTNYVLSAHGGRQAAARFAIMAHFAHELKYFLVQDIDRGTLAHAAERQQDIGIEA